MRVWMGTVTPGQKGQTRGPVSGRDVDVREEVKETVRCFFTDLWRLNGDRGRGTPSKEYLERRRRRRTVVGGGRMRNRRRNVLCNRTMLMSLT